MLFLFCFASAAIEQKRAQYRPISKDEIQLVKDNLEIKNGELLKVTDTLKANVDSLFDLRYGLAFEGLKIYRKSYTYIWVQTKLKKRKPIYLVEKNGSRSYNYHKEWVPDDYHDREFNRKSFNSDFFEIKAGHKNPRIVCRDSTLEHKEKLKIGHWYLGDKLGNALESYKIINLEDEFSNERFPYTIDNLSTPKCPNFKFPNSPILHSSVKSFLRERSSIFFGNGTPKQPKIGDKRIEYWGIPSDVYTVVGMKSDNNIVAMHNDSSYIRSESTCGSLRHELGHFALLFSGNLSVDKVFKKADLEFSNLHNESRFILSVFMVLAFLSLVKPLDFILDACMSLSSISKDKFLNWFFLIGFYFPPLVATYHSLKFNNFSHLFFKDYYFIICYSICLLLTYFVYNFDYEKHQRMD